MRDGPEVILHGGTVLTMDVGGPDAAGARARALAVARGRIVAVGSDAEILALASSSTRRIQLRGRAVVPGFQDPHAHPLAEGVEAGWLDLRGTADLAAALRVVAASAAQPTGPFEPDRWIEARYHTADWPRGRHPTRDELDRAAPDVPLLLHHGSGHAAVANSLALAMAGITAATPDPAAATIERDAHGEPTGLVLGSDPVAPFASALPPLTPEGLRAALRRAGGRLVAAGVTAVSDADLGALGDPVPELAAYAGAVYAREFPLRLTVMPGLARLARPDDEPPGPADIQALVPTDVADRIRVGPAKFFADGALTTADAWLFEPYADDAVRGDGGELPNRDPGRGREGTSTGATAWFGRPARAPAELEERLRRAHHAGWQLATHAIGDAGIAAVIGAYERILAAAPRPDHRHRIEHAMLPSAHEVARMVALGVAAVVQPGFVAEAGDVYLRLLGRDRAARIYRYRAWLDAGLAIAFSSDRPFGGGAPLDGVRSTFRHAGPSGVRLAEGGGPTVAEALRASTATAAWVARDEDHGGRLLPGMAADLAVLSGDPTAVPAERWAQGEDAIEVVATIAGGRIVFGADDLD